MYHSFALFYRFHFFRPSEGQIVIRDINRLPVIRERIIVTATAAAIATAVAALVAATIASALVAAAVAALSAATIASALVAAAIAALTATTEASALIAAAISALVHVAATAGIVAAVKEAHALRNNFRHADFLAFLVLVRTDLQTAIYRCQTALVQVLRAQFCLFLPDQW